MSWVACGGMRAAADCGRPVTPDQFMTALGRTGLGEIDRRRYEISASTFHATRAADAQLDGYANPHDPTADWLLWFGWKLTHAELLLKNAILYDADLTPLEKQIRAAYIGRECRRASACRGPATRTETVTVSWRRCGRPDSSMARVGDGARLPTAAAAEPSTPDSRGDRRISPITAHRRKQLPLVAVATAARSLTTAHRCD
jgi:hypothetical protein